MSRHIGNDFTFIVKGVEHKFNGFDLVEIKTADTSLLRSRPITLKVRSLEEDLFEYQEKALEILLGLNKEKQQMQNDYTLLRPFNLEAAKRGEPICCSKGMSARFVAHEPSISDQADRVIVVADGNLVTYCEDGVYIPGLNSEQDLRMAPLGWVEGKPVYQGDKLWNIRINNWAFPVPDFYPDNWSWTERAPRHEMMLRKLLAVRDDCGSKFVSVLIKSVSGADKMGNIPEDRIEAVIEMCDAILKTKF